MKVCALGLLLVAMLVSSCSTQQSWDSSDRYPSSKSTDLKKLNKAISRVGKQCRLNNKVLKRISKNTQKATYITGKGQKIQSFILKNGRVVLIDLNDCSTDNFRLRGDKVADSRSASGQLYFRSTNGRIYVLTPKQERINDDSFDIFEVGTKGNRPFTNRYFYGMKRTSKGTQGIYAWRSPKCTQEEVEKSEKYRDLACQNSKAALEIRGKAIDSGRYLGQVKEVNYRNYERRSIPKRTPVVRHVQVRVPVAVEILPIKPQVQCRQVEREVEVKFLFIFSITETETQTISS